jgi:GH18 family chitinase
MAAPAQLYSYRPTLAGVKTTYNRAGLQKEVFGFATYWTLSQHSSWDYSVVSTIAYFGLSVNWDGTWIQSGGGWSGFFSQDFTNMVNEAHNAGDRVVLVIKSSGEAPLNDVVTIPTETQLVINNTIGYVMSKHLDGVNVDFEGDTNPTYPDIQAGMTNFMTQMSAQMHANLPSAFVSVDTYSGSASWDGGLFKIGDLAPVVDAMFIMAYDMSFSNMPGQAGPNAPMTGWTYNDTTAVSQYLTKAPASKIILGVPWYGYRFTTNSNAGYGRSSSATADSYSQDLTDLTCAGGAVSRGWDAPGESPLAIWYSPPSGDPCGINLNSWQELYYDNVQSLGLKYDLVNSSGIRGMGIWALGYDGGHSELWSELSTYFSCPVTVSAPASATTTEFSIGLSAGSCSVAYYDVQQYDSTLNQGWVGLKSVLPAGGSTTAVVQGFPGNTYQFRARAHSTAGVVGAWSTIDATTTTAVAANATWSHPFHGLYTVDDWGGLHADDSPPLMASAYWSGWSIVRAAHGLPGSPQSGAVLDGYGGLHSYGLTTSLSASAYWSGWDIARDFAFLPDGSGGYVLDGYGGLHAFSVNGHAAPPAVSGNVYWSGWDIARKLVIFSDGSGGYVMDGYGGLHAFGIGGAAPAPATGGPYWPGSNLAKDVVLVPGSHAGYVLDAYGGLHAFSGASFVPAPAYWPGWDIARGLWLIPSSTLTQPSGYVIDGYGGLHPFGGAPAIKSQPYWPGWDIAHNLSGA